MSGLILNDGKFYRDGVLEPLEFGNKEQIKIMEHHRYIATQLEDTGVPVDVEFETIITAKVTFKCLCGQDVWFEQESNDEDNYTDLIGVTSKCKKCSTNYILHDDEDEGLTVKIKIV